MTTTDDNPALTDDKELALTLRIDGNGQLIESEDHRNNRVFRRDSLDVTTYRSSPLMRTNLLAVESYTVLVYDEPDAGGKSVRRYFGAVVGGRKFC